jgi:hypothetical protein
MLTELSLCPMISATCKLIFIWMIMVRACWCCNSSFKLAITLNFSYKLFLNLEIVCVQYLIP